jgi:hypothetical protein
MGIVYRIDGPIGRPDCKTYIDCSTDTLIECIYKYKDKYSTDKFKFTEIEICDNSILNERKSYWIAKLNINKPIKRKYLIPVSKRISYPTNHFNQNELNISKRNFDKMVAARYKKTIDGLENLKL